VSPVPAGGMFGGNASGVTKYMCAACSAIDAWWPSPIDRSRSFIPGVS
jgi:hypothetical protein